MKTRLPALHQTTTLAIALLALVAGPARADVEDRITKSYTVQPGGQLAVEVDRGSIEVRRRGGLNKVAWVGAARSIGFDDIA